MRQAETGLLRKDFAKVSRKIEHFITDYVAASDAKGLVLGISGGLDSAVALELCARGVGKKNVLGLVLPTGITPKADVQDAVSHATKLSVRNSTIGIGPVVESYADLLPDSAEKIKGNLTARIRMSILYYYAALENYLVVGTSDKSEFMIGYFSKYGDGGSDLMPLAGLYKTQVRELAKHLGVPQEIIKKKSSPRLWPGQLAESELGMDYDTIDPILHCLVDKKMKPRQAAAKLGVSVTKVNKVKSMIKASAHKRGIPPIALDKRLNPAT